MIVFEAIIDGIRMLKDGSLKIGLETQELMPDRMSQFFAMKGLCKVALSQENITEEIASEIVKTPLKDTTEKYTPSQKLRFAILQWHGRNNHGITDDEEFYRWAIKGFIDRVNNSDI